TSGKYLARSCPDLDRIATASRERPNRQRKPSHFGSYCQGPSRGISLTARASIASGRDIGRLVNFLVKDCSTFCLFGRPNEGKSRLGVLDFAQVRGAFCNDGLQGGPDMALTEMAGLGAAVTSAQDDVNM